PDALVDTSVPDPEPPAEPTGTGSGVIVIDAGHQASGDYDQEPIGPGASETKARVSDGTQGVSTGTPESVVNLAIALKLRDALVERGFTVIMVRESEDVDISNAERAAIANEAGADLFIRLHCDGSDDSSLSGFMTLVPAENEWTGPIVAESGNAAAIIHPIIVNALGASDRGIVPRSDLSGFNWCEVPTVLFEMGLMSNPAEDEKLGSDEYQRLLADSIADATVAYMQ
ncbi:MAG: N-acetylmuramoyl-L-alanine amidase, partial [Actinobacteria bacterium]|nr:N-acetylmuramoyl-L-alanine amidase [Actinomycetota bacterium]